MLTNDVESSVRRRDWLERKCLSLGIKILIHFWGETGHNFASAMEGCYLHVWHE